MKTRIKHTLLLLMAVPFILVSCQKNEYNDNTETTAPVAGQLKTDLVYCGTPLVAPMVDYAQTVAPATVTVMNDATTLLVKFELSEPGWFINLPALFIGTPEQLAALPDVTVDFNGPNTVYFNSVNAPFGLPIGPGNYANYGTYWEYSMPLSELPECFVVVAYNRIRNSTDQSFLDIWGKSPSKTSGYYLNYCRQECPPPPPPLGGCETAYAFGESVATCFISIPGVQSNNWGWSNGPLGAGSYSWPMYAGAGQCNIGNGTHVGTLTVDYTPPTAVVTYTVFDGYVLNETHLYVGNDILPKKKNKYTTAPGQFPYKHGNLNGVSSDTFTINGLSGNIYVAAHSVVCDE